MLELVGERTRLDGDDVGSRIWGMRNWRSAFTTKLTLYSFSRGANTGPGLDGALDVHLVFVEDSDEGWCTKLVSPPTALASSPCGRDERSTYSR